MSGAADLHEADEGFHAPGPEEQWSDSLYVGGGDARSGLAFYTRIGARPNEGRVEAAFGAWLPPQRPGLPPRFLLTFARVEAPERLEGAPVAAGPVAFDCGAPFELWRIRVDGEARLWARAEDLGEHPESRVKVPVRGELRFSAWTDPFAFDRFGAGLTEHVAARHYEQPGSVSGVITVGEERFPVHGAALRDHSWGVRDWQAVPYWRWMGILVDPDHFLLVNNVGRPGGGETAGGCLMLGGELAPLVEGATEGTQHDFTARATDALGRTALLRGAAISIAPLRQRRGDRLTTVNEGLTRLEWLGHEAFGISEWLEQTT
ncbi:MAG: hypothetical protein MUF56_01800 [Solirubrobacteraceae bacterium]|jgi:hypothetical protein|nr:hypothetical protein [Solirubrobacteraceae bacterium]